MQCIWVPLFSIVPIMSFNFWDHTQTSTASVAEICQSASAHKSIRVASVHRFIALHQIKHFRVMLGDSYKSYRSTWSVYVISTYGSTWFVWFTHAHLVAHIEKLLPLHACCQIPFFFIVKEWYNLYYNPRRRRKCVWLIA